MEYRTVSTKLPSNELTLFRAHCEKKGVTPASLIKELILREMKITIPHTIAGRNEIEYGKTRDAFTWSVRLDDGEKIGVLRDISPSFIEDLHEMLTIGLQERSAFINKKNKDSVPIPSDVVRSKK
jgi:hypothetical protein